MEVLCIIYNSFIRLQRPNLPLKQLTRHTRKITSYFNNALHFIDDKPHWSKGHLINSVFNFQNLWHMVMTALKYNAVNFFSMRLLPTEDGKSMSALKCNAIIFLFNETIILNYQQRIISQFLVSLEKIFPHGALFNN